MAMTRPFLPPTQIAIRHEVFDTWQQPHATICHGQVTYTRHDSSQLSVPFANVFKMRDGLI